MVTPNFLKNQNLFSINTSWLPSSDYPVDKVDLCALYDRLPNLLSIKREILVARSEMEGKDVSGTLASEYEAVLTQISSQNTIPIFGE